MDKNNELKNYYTELFRQYFDPVIIFDNESSKIFSVNEKVISLFGYTESQLLNMKFEDIIIDDYNTFSIISNHTYFRFICRAIKSNGDTFFTHACAGNYQFEDKKYTYLSLYPSDENIVVNSNLSQFYEDMANAMVLVNPKAQIIAVNQSFTNLFGYTLHEVHNKNIFNLLSPTNYEDEAKYILEQGVQGKIITISSIRKKKDQKLFNCNVTVTPYIYDGDIVGAQVFYKDISDDIFKHIELSMFKKIIESNNDGIIITDKYQKIIWVNDAFSLITEFSSDEAISKTPAIVKSNLHSREFYQGIWKNVNEKGSWQGEIWNRKKSGIIYPQWLHIIAIKDSKGEVTNYASIFKSLDDIGSINKKFLLMIEKDSLTALYNRTYFIEKVKNLLIDNFSKFYLLFIDINNFKQINDTYGHITGDKLLVHFAKNLIEVFNGHIISRYGGDEFLVFIKDVDDKKEVIRLIEKLNKKCIIDDKEFDIQYSIGIVEYPKDGHTAEELISKADIAMYIAKRDHKKYIFCED